MSSRGNLDEDDLPEEYQKYIEINAKFFEENIEKTISINVGYETSNVDLQLKKNKSSI